MHRLFGPVAGQAMIYGCVRPLPCSVEALRAQQHHPPGWYNKSLLVSDRVQRCLRRILVSTPRVQPDPVLGSDSHVRWDRRQELPQSPARSAA